jgi:hypothetical protein
MWSSWPVSIARGWCDEWNGCTILFIPTVCSRISVSCSQHRFLVSTLSTMTSDNSIHCSAGCPWQEQVIQYWAHTGGINTMCGCVTCHFNSWWWRQIQLLNSGQDMNVHLHWWSFKMSLCVVYFLLSFNLCYWFLNKDATYLLLHGKHLNFYI